MQGRVSACSFPGYADGEERGLFRLASCTVSSAAPRWGGVGKYFPAEGSVCTEGHASGRKKGNGFQIKALYQGAGISHILAISGLHISLLGMGLYRLLSRFLSPKLSGLLSCGVLFSYLVMTGFSASAARAGIMLLLYMTAKIVGRTYDMPTALSTAAALLLLENPAWLQDGGFQLSFAAAAGAAVTIPACERMGSDAVKLFGKDKKEKLYKNV